jgi:holo-[acyl-carrier protein] synthase
LSSRCFTPAERSYCEARRRQKYASYAARFAGKEALVKALGIGFRAGRLIDISIENDELGRPRVILNGAYKEAARERKVEKIHISLSHAKEWAIAQVVLEGSL